MTYVSFIVLADWFKIFEVLKYAILEDTARYAGLLLPPAGGFGQGFFWPLAKKMAYYAVWGHFRPFLVFSSNFSNFK